MSKKIYRTWKDDLKLWVFYALMAGTAAGLILFMAPRIYIFMRTLDWGVLVQKRMLYSRWVLQGLLMTLRISSVSMVFALILGTLVGIGRLSRFRIVRAFCTPYVEFFRNTPLLVQLFFWYFGTSILLDMVASFFAMGKGLMPGTAAYLQGQVLAMKDYYNHGDSEFISGVVGLTIYTSAFIAEVVRAGIMAIPHGQTEAARSTGLNTFQTLRSVILPQAFRVIIPPLISQFLNLTKNSSQAMAIGVAEMTYMARQVEANTFRGFEAFSIATLLYMMISLTVSFLLNRYDRAISIPVMVKKKQRLLSLRGSSPGYRLGKVFAFLSLGAGVMVLYQSMTLILKGAWLPGFSLATVGLWVVFAAFAAANRPSWGLGVVRGALIFGGLAVFFDLLQRLNTGLTAFTAPVDQVILPVAWTAVYGLAAAFWWHYFDRREVLFVYKGDGGP
jgi:polar amino acid transport system permease protein